MSQDKHSQPAASSGQPQNIFSMYGYHPQFPTSTVVTEQQKGSMSGQHVVQGGSVYLSQLISETAHASGQQSSANASAMPQPHTHPAQHQHNTGVPASGQVKGQIQQSVGHDFTRGISNLPTVFANSTANSAFHAPTTQPASASSVQAAGGIERQSASLTTSKWQAQQFSPYKSSSQVGASASGSLPVNTQRQVTEVTLSASLPSTVSHSLIQQDLLTSPLYSQGSVSSVGPVTLSQAQYKTVPTPSASSVKVIPPKGQATLSTSQAQPSVEVHSISQGSKRKISPRNEDDSVQVRCDNKQPRTTWNIGRPSSNVSTPLASAQIPVPSAAHTNTSSGGGWSAGNTTAKSSSGFMDTFRSFVENTSQGAYSKQKVIRDHPTNAVVSEDPVFAIVIKNEDLSVGNLSQQNVAVGAGSQEGYRLGEGQINKLKTEPAQPASQSFVEKMHATIFSLSEEVSEVGGEGSGQQSISGTKLASILGDLDGTSPDTQAGRQPQIASSASAKSLHYSSGFATNTSTIYQNTSSITPQMDYSESSASPVLQSLSDRQGVVKSEPTKQKVSLSDASADHQLKKSTISTSHDGTATSDSETESEMEPAPLTATNPGVSSSCNKKQMKDPRNTAKESLWDKPLVKVSVATLKRTGTPFLQNGSCSDLPYKVSKCRECRIALNQNVELPNIFCRFYAFRKLKYHTVKGSLMKAGFSELSDADPDHIEPWLPKLPMEEPQLDKDMAKFILSKVGDKFCELVQQEKEAKALCGADNTVVWKRAVTGVREMCDVCQTTIFNMHWVCPKCGYVVCLDCFKVRISDGTIPQGETYRKWQICTSSRYPHDASKLILTQIIPSDALWELGRMIHDIRRKWSIPTACPCGQGGPDPTASKSPKKMQNGLGEDGKSRTASAQQPVKKEPESQGRGGSQAAKDTQLVKEQKTGGMGVKQEGGVGSQKLGGCTSLRELLTKTAGKGKVVLEKKPKPSGGSSLNDIIQSVVEKSCRDLGDTPTHAFKFLHYIPRLGQWKRELPIVAHSLTETSVLYPDVPHSWLCDGRLLRLHEPNHKGNLQIFQEQWKRGQPVLVSSVHKLVKEELWKPSSFSRQFGDKKNDLVNCHNGDIITDHPMKDFWDGFESIENRLADEHGQDLMLKLKDWPPGDDFAELLPAHFQDLMATLPLPEYTRRDGKLNLASRLPEFLVRPDLGPKMYNAFGSAKFPKEATTNLHLDISDAVNVLVYVGVPSDGPRGKREHEEAAVKAIDEAGCDSITKRRVREVHELPGALWQIYDAHDADKIRDFLNKVAKERGEEIEPNHDPIHDQSWYLDEELRDRLLKEYGVQGYTIVQCLGDSVFIPAGAPHQVRNLHSCIKVAEDFVSPEHLNHCFRLTQEFRQLSETHSNHEDKLQVKNIIYHAVKDSIAVLREMDPDDEQ